MSVTPDTRRPGGRPAEAVSLLRYLGHELQQARRAASAAGRDPAPEPEAVQAARAHLLQCLESYVAALTARHLPVPPSVRDELRLQRCLLAGRLAGGAASGRVRG